MSLGNLVAVVFGLAFGGALLMLSPAKAGAAMVGLAAAVTILRFPFWGLLLFALVATFMPYSTVNVGIRSTVSEAILALTWGAVLWHIFLSRLPPAPALRYRSTERMLLWLMLFTVLPFVVGQVSIKAEASGLSNWLRWLLNLSIVFLAGRLLVERKNRETLVIALLLGTLAMLLMSIAVFIRYRSASGMAPILAMFNYANLDTLKFGLEALSSRMGSPWMHPNATGGIMALLLPLAFCYGVANQGWRRGLGLAVAVLGAAAILLASSRGAMLSLAVVLFWMSLRKVPTPAACCCSGSAWWWSWCSATRRCRNAWRPSSRRRTPVPRCASTSIGCSPRPSPAIRWESASRSTRRCRVPTSWASPTCG